MAREFDYIPNDVTQLVGSELHYNIYESSLSQRNMYDKNLYPNVEHRDSFKFQLFQDYAMTH